jgi:hypothetical protein
MTNPATVVAEEILNGLLDDVLWRMKPTATVSKDTHTRLKGTLNSDTLYHAVATARALRGHEDRSRSQLRELASNFYKRVYPRYEHGADPTKEFYKKVHAEPPATRARMNALFPLQGDPPFIRGLHSQRPWTDEDGVKKAPPPTPHEYGLERAFSAMQQARRRDRCCDLQWNPDIKTWWPDWRDPKTAPKGMKVKPGQRMPEYLEWYAAQARDPLNFGTLYDLEALACKLPEKLGFLVHFEDDDKQIRAIGVGPAPKDGEEPYPLMWSGDDRCLFWAVAPKQQRVEAQAVADRMVPPYNFKDWKGSDLFRREITRSAFRDAIEAFADADVEPTATRLAERFGTTEARVRLMREQLKHDGLGYYDACEEEERHRVTRKLNLVRTRHAAVSVGFRVYDPTIWTRSPEEIEEAYGKKRKGIPGSMQRTREEYMEGRDEPSIHAPFKKHKMRARDVWDVSVTVGTALGRIPLVGELCPALAKVEGAVDVDARATAVLFDSMQAYLRETNRLPLNSFSFGAVGIESGE